VGFGKPAAAQPKAVLRAVGPTLDRAGAAMLQPHQPGPEIDGQPGYGGPPLTPRECQVLEELCAGCDNDEIAAAWVFRRETPVAQPLQGR